MISRRNIRVKVMQTLYALASLEQEERLNNKLASGTLDNKLARSLDLFTTIVLYIIHIAQYAETDARQKASKYLLTDEDLNVSTKIASNEFLNQIQSNKTFNERVKESNAERYVDAEWVKKIYQQLTRSTEYKNYIAEKETNLKQDREILQYLWTKEMLENEALQSHFTDELPGWEDDSEMIAMLIENFFKSNAKINFMELLSAEKKQYAHSLLHTVMEKGDHLMAFINPKLSSNWDPERIAMIDMIVLQMGVSEFLYFPTIPAKVTINEYIEITKQYSSVQSAQFVNGVLDNILKDLVKENKIRKEERSGKS